MGSSGQEMKARGHQLFADALARFADECADARVDAIAETAAAPLRVTVRGRRGAGRATVARALSHVAAASGLSVMTSDGSPDLVVHVLAEVVKPEDAQAIATAGCPVLAVLNKIDLLGPLTASSGDGPLATARSRCARLAALAGVPVEPMIGLLAVAAFEEFDEHALRTLAADNPVLADARLRLLDSLDVFGMALGIAAVRRGGTSHGIRALLRQVGGVDAVVATLSGLGAELRYRRVLDAVAQLEALAVGHAGVAERISDFLACDDTVIARMAAAVDMADAAALDPGRDEPGHLSRALRWQRYSRGPVSVLQRSCGADIARGSLRLWSGASR
jgi:hypothetical protein